MPRTGGLIDGEPLLVASTRESVSLQLRPGLAAVCRAPHVFAKKREVYVRLETEIEKCPCFIGVCHWVTTEDAVFEDAGKRPCYAAIGGVTPAGLPEVGGN